MASGINYTRRSGGSPVRSIVGHARGGSVIDKLTPMMKEVGFNDVETIATHYKKFAFIRGR
jgi:hypothetical protein